MDKKSIKCLMQMLKFFTCGKGIDGCSPNDAPSRAYINSPVLDAKPLSGDKSLLNDEILHGQRISSEDEQFLEERCSPNDATSRANINSPVNDAKPLSGDKSLPNDEVLLGHRISSEDEQFLEERCSPHGHNCYHNSHLPVVMHDDSMPLGNNHSIDDNLLIDNKIHDNNLLLLPNDIIINILSRLNIQSDALQCRRVCRPISEMMSSPFFTTMNLNRATPILVLQRVRDCSPWHKTYDSKTDLHAYDIVLHIVDEGNKRILTRKFEIMNYEPKKNSCVPDLIGSYNGLLLFRNSSEGAFFIINPITQEQVVVKGQPDEYEERGVYVHPPTNEYRILYVHESLIKPPRFYILSLTSKSFREISNNTAVAPCTHQFPIILNGAMHWMGSVYGKTKCLFADSPAGCSKSILAFNLESEEFILIPHPGSECCSKERQGTNVQLLEMEGHLCLCDTSTSPAEVHVWICENYSKKNWIKRHIINIESLILDPDHPNYHWWPYVEALRIHNGDCSECVCVFYIITM